MQNIINWLLACTVFIASFTCYAMGNEAGAIVLILLGRVDLCGMKNKQHEDKV